MDKDGAQPVLVTFMPQIYEKYTKLATFRT